MMVKFKRFIGISFFAVIAVFASMLVLLLGSFGSGQGFPPDCSAGSFALHGTVINSSYTEALTNLTNTNRSVNISIYNMSFGQTGGKSLMYVNSTFTTATTGNFTLGVRTLGDAQSDCSQMYVITAFYYNTSPSSDPSTWVVEEMGPSFPILPKIAMTMFFDNVTIYLQPAATLNISAVNESHNVSFNYAVFDNTLGFPVAESFTTKVAGAKIVIPRNRNYTIMMMISPDFNDPGSFMTAAPPQAVSVNNLSDYGSTNYVAHITKNLSFSQQVISGNISVVGNTTPVNVSDILVKLSFNNMLPPNSVLSMPNGIGISNLTSPVVTSSGAVIANYSVVVMGSASGIDQILEFFASNTTSSANDTQYFYAIQNFTVTDSVSGGVANITLRQLAGSPGIISQGGLSVPSKYVHINISDSTGSPLTEAHVETFVDNVGQTSPIPQFRYMMDQLTGGVASLPLRLDSNATVKIFSRRYAPSQYKLNITNASLEPDGQIHITVNSFKPEMRLSNGSISDFSGSKAGNMKVTFTKNTFECNSPNASISGCKIGKDFSGGFNPLSAMFAGKTNIVMELPASGVILQFLGADMLASGPPDSSMSDSALSSQNGSKFQQAWRFGSVAPRVYDKVLIGVPYNQTLVIENASKINVTIKNLFDEKWNLVWNSSENLLGNATPSEWSDYNQSWFNVTGGGMACQFDIGYNDTNFAQGCIVNTTTNYVWMVLPHFSGGDDTISSESDTTPPIAPTSIAISGLPNGNAQVTWTDAAGEAGETYIVYRSLLNITPLANNLSNYSSSVTNLTPVRIREGVQAFIDNTTSNNTIYFYAVAAADSVGNLQNSAGVINLSNSYNVTINDTVMPKAVQGLNISASSGTVTLRWLNVTQDVLGGADFFNLTYKIYHSGANGLVNISTGANISHANLTLVGSVSASSNTTTVTETSNGTYHYIVTTLDDGGNENRTIFLGSNYANISVTIASGGDSGSSSSSSGGGGGGGITAPSEGVKFSKVWATLPEGVAEMNITRFDISFKKIVFTTSNALANAELAVTKLDNKPNVTTVSGTVYQYLKVDKTNIQDSDLTKVVISFSVEKKWFDQTGGLIKDIVLQRYTGGKWVPLSTAYTRSDQTYQYFDATSPGFSYFAVTLRKVSALAAAPTTTGSSSSSNANATGNASASGTNEDAAGSTGGISVKNLPVKAIIIVVLAVALVGGGAFFVIRKGGPGKLFGGKFKGFGGRTAKPKTQEEQEAEKVVKEYESQKHDSRRPPEAFN